MATLNQLIENHSKIAGDIKVINLRQPDLTNYFVPFYQNTLGDWIGLLASGSPRKQELDETCKSWMIWDEDVIFEIKRLLYGDKK